MADIVMELRHIQKFFGSSQVIHDVSFQVKKGDFVTLLGPSGCGKTTILRMIAGFYEPDSGEIELAGRRIERVAPYDRNTAMVFQEYALFPHMNVFENVAYGLRVRHEGSDSVKKKVGEALALMQLNGLESRYPNQMSGGQQQRVAVARALVMNPDVLLLDEPLSNLDAKLRESVRVELRAIQQQMGLTTIYVTHDQQEALSMSDSIIVMKQGVLHQQGRPEEIYFAPKTPFVADFIGTTNLLPIEGNGSCQVVYGSDPLLADTICSVGTGVLSVRPESVRLSRTADAADRVNVLTARVTHSMFLGEKRRYFLQDRQGREWLADLYDPGIAIFNGDVYMQFAADRSHAIVGQEPG
jgi:ABC-type Fe3+/spermidine/putrescine transport system ATPase subunit